MNRTTAANRIWTGSGIVAGRLAKRAAGTSWPVRIGAVFVGWKAVPAVIEQAHQQPWIMPGVGVAWAWAAWRSHTPHKIDNPSPPHNPDPTPTAPTCTDSGQKGPATTVGEGFTIIDDPTNPARAIVIHKEHAA